MVRKMLDSSPLTILLLKKLENYLGIKKNTTSCAAESAPITVMKNDCLNLMENDNPEKFLVMTLCY